MSMFKMENTGGHPKVKTYLEADIKSAVKKYVMSWDIQTIIDYAIDGTYEKYMDRKQPRKYIDNLMEEFNKK